MAQSPKCKTRRVDKGVRTAVGAFLHIEGCFGYGMGNILIIPVGPRIRTIV